MLTTVNQPVYEMGTIAFETIVDRIQKGPDAPNKSIVLEPELIIRTTTRGETNEKN
jgi:DNA-binding LacI/PurR family transcriptional regulator